MKRIISFAAALSMMFAAASCQKDLAPKGEDSTVSFSFELPEGAVTKAHLSSASLVNQLVYEVYVGNDVMYEGTVARAENGNFSLELNLVTGQKYDLLFWAQYNDDVNSHYSPYYNATNLKAVRVSYKSDANDEKRDAFFGSRLGFEPSGIATQETVYLYRPFAQVNFATSEEDWRGASSFVNEGLDSSVEFDRLPDVFNVFEGDVKEGEYTDNKVELGYALAPISDRTHDSYWISYDGKQFAWVAMNYVLASKEEMTVTAKAKFVHKKNTPETALIREVPSVPVKQNYRTNILGEFFTGGNKFEIVIVPGFVNSNIVDNPLDDTQNPDYILTIPIRQTFEWGGEISLDQDLTISSPFELKNGKDVKVNLNGHNITCTNGSHAFVVTEGTLTVEGEGTVTTEDKTGGFTYFIRGENSEVNIKGGTYVIGVDDVDVYAYPANSAVYVIDGGKAYISGGEFKAVTNQNYAADLAAKYLLNLRDKTNAGQDENEIQVTGGKFYNFNPADNLAEGQGTTFVPAGYQSVETSTGVWTVSAL